MRRRFFWVSLLVISGACVVAQETERACYKSPYSINPSAPTKDLMGDLLSHAIRVIPDDA